MKQHKVILFGGSFEPIHLGHKETVDLLLNQFENSTVIVMPSQNWLKNTGVIPIAERIEAAKMVFASYKNVEVVDWALFKDISSTYEVNSFLKSLYPDSEIWIAAGEDILVSLPKWKYFPEVATEINWIFISRHQGKIINGEHIPVIQDLIKRSPILPWTGIDLSSTELRENPSLLDQSVPKEALPFVKKYFKS